MPNGPSVVGKITRCKAFIGAVKKGKVAFGANYSGIAGSIGTL